MNVTSQEVYMKILLFVAYISPCEIYGYIRYTLSAYSVASLHKVSFVPLISFMIHYFPCLCLVRYQTFSDSQVFSCCYNYLFSYVLVKVFGFPLLFVFCVREWLGLELASMVIRNGRRYWIKHWTVTYVHLQCILVCCDVADSFCTILPCICCVRWY